MNSKWAPLKALGSRSGLALAVGVVLIAVATAVALWNVFAPEDRLLFGNLAESDAAEISTALDEWKVPYRFTEDGTGILVDGTQMHAVRMRLVSAGIPKGGHVGFELFDNNEFGITEFAQRINYQRALQGEIERTISALPGVKSARVHLSMRKPGLFLGDNGDSKASVALTLAPGASLARPQVVGIRNLVASAVEGLAPEHVVVVGPSGIQLAGADAANVEDHGLHSESASRIAYELEEKVRQLLRGAFEGRDFAVSVHTRLNFDSLHRVSERVLAPPGVADGLVVRRSRNGSATSENAGVGPVSEDVEYAHGREREETTRAPGAIERLSVAVLLPEALPQAQLDEMRRLVAAAVGLDPTRGDTLEIAFAPVPFRLAVDDSAVVDGAEGVGGDGRMTPGMSVREGAGRPHYAWMALTWVLGLVMGIAALSFGRRRSRRLAAAEAEAAERRIREWLADTAP